MNKQSFTYTLQGIIMFAIVVLAGISFSCTNTSLVNRRLTAAENLLEQYPDSALSILDLIESDMSDDDSDIANFGLLHAHARLMCGKTIADDKYIDRSISYYLENKDSMALSEAYQLASIRSQHRFDQDSSIYYLQQAVDVTPESQKSMRAQLLTKLSYQLSKPSVTKDYHKALHYSMKACKIADTATDKARALHDVGIIYSFMGRNDSSLSYIKRALELIDPGNPYYQGFALNYANTPGADYEACKKFLSEVKSESLGKHITLGFIYLNNGLADSAYLELEKANDVYLTNPGKYSINSFNNLRLLRACLNFSKGKIIDVSEGVTTNDSISDIMNLEQRLSNEQLETNAKLETDILKHKVKNQQTLTCLLAVVLIASLTIFLLYYIWHQRYKRLQNELEKQRVSQILLEASDSPIDEEALQAIIAKRLRLCIARFRDSGYYTKLQKVEAENDPDSFLPLKQRIDIQEKLLECFSDFVIDLKNESAKLNLEDILYCLLTLLNLNSKTISRCMGASEGALRTRKSRLKGKLSPLMLQMIFHDTNI